MTQEEDDNSETPPTPETHDGGGAAGGGAERDGDVVEEAAETREETNPEVDRLHGAVEAILLVAEGPVETDELADALEASTPNVERALDRLKLEYSGEGRGIHLERIAGGWQFRTNPAFDDAVRSLVASQPIDLSRAAMEALAIVAYRQPVTRAEVEEIRGVDSSGVLRTLQEAELVRVVGRLDDLGRPHVYGTSDRFLELFGLDNLTDLPTLSESEQDALEELYREELDEFDEEFE